MAEARGVLVVAELAEGRVAPVSGELLAVGRQLADGAGEELAAVVAGEGVEPFGRELIASGADRVYLLEHPLLRGPQVEAHVGALERLVRETAPRVVLLGKTLFGMDLGPRLAFRLRGGLAQDCVDLALDPATRSLVALRPVSGGAALARVILSTPPLMATVRPKRFQALAPDPGRRGLVAPFPVVLEPEVLVTRVLERVKEEARGVRLEDARVVVSGGRGLGGPEGFKLLQEVADLLGGAVGATRAVCDAGWLPFGYQIGLTGRSVSPDLYIAVALSGASQHMAGCSGAKAIVAINSDPEAPIFKEAKYGVLGDWRKVLPAFLETVRELAK